MKEIITRRVMRLVIFCTALKRFKEFCDFVENKRFYLKIKIKNGIELENKI